MASLDEIRKLQKRARDKEYRLRKQGASQGNIAQVSPRQDWSAVKSMNSKQRNAYAKKLGNFNKKAKLVGSVSGDVIPRKYLDQASRLIAEHNKFVRKEAKRIQGIAPDLWAQYVETQKGVLKTDGIGGLLTTIDVKKMNNPRSLEAAKARVKRYEKRNKRDFAFYRKIQKKNMRAMMNTLGLYDLSELVRTMSAEQFDVLSSVLPTWDRLTPEYYAGGTKAAGMPEYDDIRSYVYKAMALNEPDEAAVYSALDAKKEARDKKGRRLAKAAATRAKNKALKQSRK